MLSVQYLGEEEGMSNCSLKMLLQSQDPLRVCSRIFMLTLSQVLTKIR